MGTESVSLFVAFSAGILSIVSPCVVALVPVYVTYLSGASLGSDVSDEATRRHTVRANSLMFVAGFSLIFILFGASATLVGQVLLRHQVLVRQLAGVLVIVFGLHVSGLLELPFLDREKRFQLKVRTPTPKNSLLVGMAFAAGWAPCIGPILGSILLLAGTTQTVAQGILLLTVYSAGMAIPFLFLGFSLGRFSRLIGALTKHAKTVSVVSGVFLVLVGIGLYTNFFFRLAGLFNYYDLFL